MKDRLLSIVIPAYNEEENIRSTARAVLKTMDGAGIPCELIFVSDGSKDKTFQEVLAVSREEIRVHGLEFSRNFGKEAAIRAGLERTTGACVVVMDCDLQHPPETAVEMYRLWEQGCDVVEGIKKTRGDESAFHKFLAGCFYKTISLLTGFDLRNTSDFKLLSRRVVDSLLQMPERKTFFRAMSFWVGYPSAQVTFDVAERKQGCSKWSFWSLVRYATSNVVAFSTRPLFFVNFMGAAALIFGTALGIQTCIRWVRGSATEGFTTVILLLLILDGGILMGLGLIGSYVAAIYNEVKQRPRYLVDCETERNV